MSSACRREQEKKQCSSSGSATWIRLRRRPIRLMSRSWMGFSILWGLNIAYSLATLYYQAVTFHQHPQYSLICILAVVLFNILVLSLLRRARSRIDPGVLGRRQAGEVCCEATSGSCH